MKCKIKEKINSISSYIFAKKKGIGAVGYMLLFMVAMLMIIVMMYLLGMAKIITYQRDIDDALADSVLASLIIDEEYLFDSAENGSEGIIKIRDKDESYDIYKDCMESAIEGKEDFYYNVSFDKFIIYEIEAADVYITTYDKYGNSSFSHGVYGEVKTPDGKVVIETSAYAYVTFDIKSILDGSYINKNRSIYCTVVKD